MSSRSPQQDSEPAELHSSTSRSARRAGIVSLNGSLSFSVAPRSSANESNKVGSMVPWSQTSSPSCGPVNPSRRGISSSETLLSTTVASVDNLGATFRSSPTLLNRRLGPGCAASPTRVPRCPYLARHLDVRTTLNKVRTAPLQELCETETRRLKVPVGSSRACARLPVSTWNSKRQPDCGLPC